MKKTILLFVTAVFVWSITANAQLSFTKKRYSKGWYVETKASKKKVKEVKSNQEITVTGVQELKNEHQSFAEIASVKNEINSPVVESNPQEVEFVASTALVTPVVKQLKPRKVEMNSPIQLDNKQLSKVEKRIEKILKKAEKSNLSSPAAGGKSNKKWVVALLLVIFVGGLGIHRFYLGYTWQGVVQLLTGGGCGVWALIDLIRIIMRDLKPKDGDYVD